MSAQNSFVSVPSSQVGDNQPANYVLGHAGSVYLSPLTSVISGQTQGFAIDAFGRQILIGASPDNNAFIENPVAVGGIYRAALPTYDDGDQATFHHDVSGRLLSRVTGDAADNAALSGNPVRVGGGYNLALPTYDDGDQATIQHDVNGRVRTNDYQTELLSKNAGAVDAQTLRTQATDEDVARSWIHQGPAADNAAAAGNPLRNGGVYNLALPTYGDGDIGSLQIDANGYLRVRDEELASLDKNAGAVSANTLRVQPTTEALANNYFVRGVDADNAAPTVNPLAIAGRYQAALPTYDDGDIGFAHIDSSGRLITFDAALDALSKNAGAVDASTLRVQLSNENLVNEFIIKGTEVVDSAVANNGIRVGGTYDPAFLGVDAGDFVDLRFTALGQLLVFNEVGYVFARDAGKVIPITPVAGTVVNATITVGVAAVRCTTDGAAPGADRVLLSVSPDQNATGRFWIGSATVGNAGATRGKEIFPGETWERERDAGDYYIISDTAAQEVYIVEQE